MSNHHKLLSKVEVFERLSVYGNRSDFLQSLAIDYDAVDDQDLVSTVNSVKNAIKNWIAGSAEEQSDIPGRIKGLPPGLRTPFQTVRGTNDFNISSLPKVYQALLQLSTVNNLGNMGDAAKSAWLQSVFPVLGVAMQKVKKQIDYLNAYAAKFRNQNDAPAPTGNANFRTTLPETTIEAPVNTYNQKSLVDGAKSLSNILTNKISKLPDSFNRVVDLKNINENVKSLQRYFRALQNKNDMPSYFARMEIVKALQNALNTLGEVDMNTVSALNAGVPETPESKI